MFIKRLLTVLVLVPLAVWLILGTTVAVFQIFTALLCLLAAWEWAGLMGVEHHYNKFVYVILVLAALSIGLFIPYMYLLWVALAWWIVVTIILWRYTRKPITHNNAWLTGIAGIFCIVPCWVGLNSLRSGDDGAWWLLTFLFLLWATDSGAYIAGRLFGKHKLAPSLSPGKTWQGVIGGIIFMLIFAVIGLFVLKIPSEKWLAYFVVTLIMSVFSIIGDLFESMLKRVQGVKDSGAIFPGHGGMLDRMDSVFAAAPIFALLISVAGLLPVQ